MPVAIEIHGKQATVKDGVWWCVDPLLTPLLNNLRHPDGPWGYDPDPDMTLANAAVKQYGAVIKANFAKPESDPNVVY